MMRLAVRDLFGGTDDRRVAPWVATHGFRRLFAFIKCVGACNDVCDCGVPPANTIGGFTRPWAVGLGWAYSAVTVLLCEAYC